MPHVRPKEPLANRGGSTAHLLSTLSENDVAEYLRFWSARRDEYQSMGDGRSAWEASKRLAGGQREMMERGDPGAS